MKQSCPVSVWGQGDGDILNYVGRPYLWTSIDLTCQLSFIEDSLKWKFKEFWHCYCSLTNVSSCLVVCPKHKLLSSQCLFKFLQLFGSLYLRMQLTVISALQVQWFSKIFFSFLSENCFTVRSLGWQLSRFIDSISLLELGKETKKKEKRDIDWVGFWPVRFTRKQTSFYWIVLNLHRQSRVAANGEPGKRPGHHRHYSLASTFSMLKENWVVKSTARRVPAR